MCAQFNVENEKFLGGGENFRGRTVVWYIGILAIKLGSDRKNWIFTRKT